MQKRDALRLELQQRFVNREVTEMRSKSGKNRNAPTRPHKSGRPQRPRPPTQSQAPAAPKPPSGGHFLWGRHAVLAALANPERRIAALYGCGDSAEEIKQVIASLPASRQQDLPPIHDTDRRRLDALQPVGDGDKAVHQGMAAAVWPLESPDLATCLAPFRETATASTATSARQRILLLDQLSDPRNVGAIIRSALALGASAIIATHRNAPEETGALARAAVGALARVPLIRVVNLARAIEACQDAGFTVAGLAGEGAQNVSNLAQIDRLALVMGAEGSGLRHLTRKHCDMLVRIDICEDSESLNVSTAAAIALYAAGPGSPTGA